MRFHGQKRRWQMLEMKRHYGVVLSYFRFAGHVKKAHNPQSQAKRAGLWAPPAEVPQS